MAMIDIKNLDKLTPQQREQFNNLLDNFPHLDSKMNTSRELNTPVKLADEANFITPNSQPVEELDYSNFVPPSSEEMKRNKSDFPTLKVDPNDTKIFTSLEKTDAELTPKEKEDREKRIAAHKIQSAIASGQPEEVAKFNPTGKVHPILHKLRATVGLRAVQKPVEINVGGCRYALKSLDRMSLSNATVLAITTSNSSTYQANLDTAIVAFSVVTIDNAPLTDIFEIPYNETLDGKELPIAETRREQLAAEAFYMELQRNPNELTEALIVHYQQEFPQLNLLTEGKAKFICPVGNCLQTRIDDENGEFYCPIHGEKLAKEEMFPNPL